MKQEKPCAAHPKPEKIVRANKNACLPDQIQFDSHELGMRLTNDATSQQLLANKERGRAFESVFITGGFMKKTYAALGASLSLAFTSPASADNVLTFGGLPSTQGWVYNTGATDTDSNGVKKTIAENQVFSVVDAMLHMNTLVTPNNGTGGIEYVLTLPGKPASWSMKIVARVISAETEFAFFMGGRGNGSTVSVGVGFSPINYLDNKGNFPSAPLQGFDPSVFNMYELRVEGGLQSLYVNGQKAIDKMPIAGGGTPNQVVFGDGTGFKNADVEIANVTVTTQLPICADPPQRPKGTIKLPPKRR